MERIGTSDRFIEGPESEHCEMLADILGDELEEVHDVLGLAREPGSQLGVLCRHTHGAGVEMADPHHDAAGHDQRSGGESELLGAEQGRDHDISAGAQRPIALNGDPVA